MHRGVGILALQARDLMRVVGHLRTHAEDTDKGRSGMASLNANAAVKGSGQTPESGVGDSIGLGRPSGKT